jgi:HEPN domain-containing protein
MNRQDFREMARIRLREAEVLLRNRQYSGAYYLSGYVIECALKACIAKQTRRYDFPDKKKASDSFTHDLEKLIDIAELRAELRLKISSEPVFEANWKIVKAWNEQSRYDKRSRGEAEGLFNAITDSVNGVFTWLEIYW